jgi:hypothetical protein
VDELEFCRDHGIEPLPKLNFSACHDAWLGRYSRMLSTPAYCDACAALIGEVCELFDGPRLFHIGMDEEDWSHQKNLEYVVVRQGDLWWHDLELLIERVERSGSRAWVWSDVLWDCGRDLFSHRMPRSAVQSNWYYSAEFPQKALPNALASFEWLEQMGYEQIPTGSTWSSDQNYGRLVDWCEAHVGSERLAGYMMADWRATTAFWQDTHVDAISIAGRTHSTT